MLFTAFTWVKITINPFVEAQDLLNKSHKTDAHLSHGEKRYKELYSYKSSMTGVLTIMCIKLDLNEMRVSDRCNLAHSILRIHKGLACCFVRKHINWMHTSDDFLKLADMEGVSCLSAQFSEFSRHEKSCNNALGVAEKNRMMSKLRSERVSLIYLSSTTKSKQCK